MAPVQQGNAVLSTLDNEEEKKTEEEDVKDFACEFCPKTFLTRKSLTAHKATHMKKDSKCNECEKVFDTKCKLVNHVNTVHSKNVHQCTDCGKSFLASKWRYQCCLIVSLCH